jgi:curved DNA-binding protein CbpA
MMEIVDFYRILQVDPQAEPEVIQAAHRTLARKYHPDIPGGSESRMVAINQAWDVLSNPRSRSAYDQGRSVVTASTTPPAPRPAEPIWGQGAPKPTGPASGTVLDFGRYAGWSFGQIARHDPDFLLWLARAPIGRAFRAEIEALLSPKPATPTASPPHPRRRFAHR